MEKKTKSRIIFWSVFFGAITLVVGSLCLFTSIYIDNHNHEIINETVHNGQEKKTTPEKILLCEDEYASIKYVGIDTYPGTFHSAPLYVIFEIENKTDTTFEFDEISLTFNHETIADNAGIHSSGLKFDNLTTSDKVPPHSTCKVCFLPDGEDSIFGIEPYSISGQILIKDSDELWIWGVNNWYHVLGFWEADLS